MNAFSSPNSVPPQEENSESVPGGFLSVELESGAASKVHPMELVIHDYLSSLKNIAHVASIVMPHMSRWLDSEARSLDKKLKVFIPTTAKPGETHRIVLSSAHEFSEFTSVVKKIEALKQNRALPILGRSLFTQLFSEYDSFTGSLLTQIYLQNDKLLRGISREISLSDLLDYADIEDVKKSMIYKEIETFRRESYVEQFAQLEKKFSLSLRKFPEWAEFVELGQRRNLITHNDGVVSDQYIAVCQREGLNFTDLPSFGEALDIDYSYFARAVQLMSKVGYMLCHTLWSKVFPKQMDDIHESLNHNLYKCLEDKRWKVAAELSSFALSEQMVKELPEIKLRIRVVNAAIALKFSNHEADAMSLLKAYDWSASYRDFRLALFVLEDNFIEAISLMKSIGKTGEIIEQHSYHTWPLFHKFREQPEFYSTYEDIYGVPYLATIPSDGSTTDVTLSSAEPPSVATRKAIKSSKRSKGKSLPATPPND